MNRNSSNTSESEKNRIRSEIDAQVEEFLKSGGKIEVVNTNQRSAITSIGSVWHGPDEIPGLNQPS